MTVRYSDTFSNHPRGVTLTKTSVVLVTAMEDLQQQRTLTRDVAVLSEGFRSMVARWQKPDF